MSLRGRLLLAVATLVVTALGVSAWVSTRITTAELDRMGIAAEGLRLDTELNSLATLLDASPRQGWQRQIRIWRGAFDALLFDADGRLVAHSDRRYGEGTLRDLGDGIEGTFTEVGNTHSFLLKVPHRTIRGGDSRYRLYLIPSPFTDRETGAEPFQASAARWTVGLVGIVGLLALAIAATVARRLAGPLEALTDALNAGDLSRRVESRGNDEIARLARAFNDMAARTERSETLRRHLVSDVAHELRTPLANLRGEVESLADGLLAPTPAVIRSLHEEVVHLGRLVEDLEALAHAESGNLRLDLATVDLAREVERSVSGGDGAPPVTIEIADNLRVRTDARRLRQILVNLIDNARRHTPEDGVVTVSATRDEDFAKIRVRDTGCGIPLEKRDDVFERFVRLDTSRQRVEDEDGRTGSGLGLAIVKQLVEAHGGRVWVEDPPAGEPGTVMAFTLPRVL